MFENNLYNLMNQAVQEHKSLWRIKNEYLNDAKSSAKSVDFWQHMMADKEVHIIELTTLIKEELNK